MANSVTMTVYLGANNEGVRNQELIHDHAKSHGMKLSEFVLYCILEQMKREQSTAK